ncbi:hypothetical protein QR685DRAFT_431314 [Neurospora intermedia]|uniref:Glycosyltransferase family 1 protein n=1 Tax=Neurospora intermedia TaxID=5142 RepID=A0ABR3DRC9_NEUIN
MSLLRPDRLPERPKSPLILAREAAEGKSRYGNDGKVRLNITRQQGTSPDRRLNVPVPLPGTRTPEPSISGRSTPTNASSPRSATPTPTQSQLQPQPQPQSFLSSGRGTRLNIVMLAVGFADDVRHFTAVAVWLRDKFGHRIRVATHPDYQAQVEGCRLEYFSLDGRRKQHGGQYGGGCGDYDAFDAQEWIKSRGPAEREKWKESVYAMLEDSWRACVAPFSDGSPFIADAIVACHKEFGNLHCAEKLGVPVHVLSRIMEIMLWCETGETINKFRTEVLELDPIDFPTAVGMRHRGKIPTTYFRSRTLRENPDDWERHIYSYGSFEETAVSVHRRLLEDCQPCSLISGELASLMARTKYTPVPLSPISAVAVVLGGASEVEELQPWQLSKPRPDLNPDTVSGVQRNIVLGHLSQISPNVITEILARDFSRIHGHPHGNSSGNINGWQSGIIAAGRKLSQNLWDGLSGVFTRPIAGAREEGTVGFLKGFGQGLGELVMKPTTGALEAPGFIFLGFYRELEKLGKADSEAQIVMGRLAQGEGEYVKLHKSERQRIVTAWRVCEGMAKGAAGNAAKRAEANNRHRLWGSALARARHGTGTILEPLGLLETLELTGAEMGMDSSMDCPCTTAETGRRLG